MAIFGNTNKDHKMKIANIQHPIFLPYNKPTIEIFISGCNDGKGRCKKCHNPQLWNFDVGDEINDNFYKNLKEKEDFYECISLLGGCPLDQDRHDLLDFLMRLRHLFPDKEKWLFTGKDEVPNWVKEYFDYIKIGKYDENLKTDGFPASSNQRVLKRGVDF